MATHSSILAWRIPWTEEPGGPQSMGHGESDTTERLTPLLLNKDQASQVAPVVKSPPPVQETWARSLGSEDPLEGCGNPLQCSCLENRVDRGAWGATV